MVMFATAIAIDCIVSIDTNDVEEIVELVQKSIKYMRK